MNRYFLWLKKHFIPHVGNDHRPYILRRESIRLIAGLVVLLELIVFLLPVLTRLNSAGQMAAVLPAILTNLTNQERQAKNLSILSISPLLTKAAELKAQDMAMRGYFAHTSPDGKTPWYWLEQAGYKYKYAGENLAVNFSDSEDVAKAWMESPTHRANIIKEKYTEVGTGVALGIYKGEETIFVAQIYANPLSEYQQSQYGENTAQEIPKMTYEKEKKQTGILGILGAESVAGEKNTGVVVEKNTVEVQNGDFVNQDQNPAKELPAPPFWQKIIASPRHAMNVVLLAVFGIMLLALFLNTFIKMKNFHPDLITNGLVVLAAAGAIFVVNHFLSEHNMLIVQSFDYAKNAGL